MKHLQDSYNLEEQYDKPICGLSSEDREYFNRLNDGHSMLYHKDEYNRYDDYDNGCIKHFQD